MAGGGGDRQAADGRDALPLRRPARGARDGRGRRGADVRLALLGRALGAARGGAEGPGGPAAAGVDRRVRGAAVAGQRGRPGVREGGGALHVVRDRLPGLRRHGGQQRRLLPGRPHVGADAGAAGEAAAGGDAQVDRLPADLGAPFAPKPTRPPAPVAARERTARARARGGTGRWAWRARPSPAPARPPRCAAVAARCPARRPRRLPSRAHTTPRPCFSPPLGSAWWRWWRRSSTGCPS